MANQQRKITYGIDFDVNDAELKKLKKQLEQLKKLSVTNYASQQGISLNSPATAEKQAHQLAKLKKDAAEFQRLMRLAYNPKTNSYNITKFNTALKQSGLNVKSFRAEMQKTAEGRAVWAAQINELTKFNTELKQSHKLLDSLGTTLANTIKWTISSSLMQGVTRSISQAYGFAKNLDSALNDIRIVTGKSADEMARFAERANAVASNLGKGTNDYTRAALIYAQQGLGQKEIEEKTAITLKTANVTGQSAEEVSEELTAVWNGYKASAAQAELYVDRLAAVASTTASNLQELSIGMSKVASAAATLGVGEDQLAAQLSTIISVTRQAPETVGTALRTVYARITDIQAGLDEDGVTLGKYSGDMEKIGIRVLDLNGNLRNMGEVMEEIGNKWSTMTQEQKIYLAQTMAGQRQYSNLMALFDNFDKYKSALNTAQNAEGKLQEQQDVYMDRLSTHIQQLTTATEHMWMGLVDTDGFKDVVDGLTTIVEKVDKLFSSIGGGKNLLQSLVPIVMSLTSKTVAKGINTMIINSQLEKRQLRDQKSSQVLAQNEMEALQREGQQGSQRYQVLKQKSEFLQAAPGTFSTQQMDEINKRWTGSLEAADAADKVRTELNQYSDIIQSTTTALGDNPIELKKALSIEDLENAIIDVSGQYNELSKKIEQYARDQDAINKQQDAARQKLIEAYSQTATKIVSEKNESQFKQFNVKNLRKYESTQAQIISQEQQKLNSLPALSDNKKHIIDTSALTGMFVIKRNKKKGGPTPDQISAIEKVKGFEEVQGIGSRDGKIEKIREIFENSIYQEIYEQMSSPKSAKNFGKAVRDRFAEIEQNAKKAIQQASNKQKAASQELLRRQQTTNTYQQNFQALKGNFQIQDIDKFQNNLQFLSQDFSSMAIPPELKRQVISIKKEYQELSQEIIKYNEKVQSSSKLSQEQIDTLKKEKKALEEKQQALLDTTQGTVDNINENVQNKGQRAIDEQKRSRTIGNNNRGAIEDIQDDADRQKHLEGIMLTLAGVNMLTAAYSNLGNAIRGAFYEGNWEGFVEAILTSIPMLISSLAQITNGFSRIKPLLTQQLIAKKADTAASLENAAANTTQAAAQAAAAGAAETEAAAQEQAIGAQAAETAESVRNAAANAEQAAAQTAAVGAANAGTAAGAGAAGATGGFKALAASIGLTSTAMIGLAAAAAAVIAIFAIVKIAVESRNKQAQQTIKLMEERIEKEKEVQETISHEKDVIAEVKKLNDEYKNGIITRQELKQKTAELQEKYKDESDTIKDLISDYSKLDEAIQKASDANDRAQLESDKNMALYKATIARNTDEGAVKGNEWWRMGSVSQMQSQAAGKTVLQVGAGETGFGSKLATSLSARGVGSGKGEQENMALLGGILGAAAGPVGVAIGTAAGAELGKNSLTHVDINDIQTKSQLKDVVTGLKQALDSASQEDLDTAIYQETLQQYNSLSDQLKEWQAADLAVLHDIAHNTAKAVSKNFNFVDSFDEYQKAYSDSAAQMYEKLSNSNQKYGEGDNAKTFNELTTDEQWDIISSELEKVIPQDLKTEYGDRMDALNLYNHLYGNGYFKSGKENDLSKVATVEGLNEDQLKIWDSYLDDAFQANLTTEQINETLDYIANHDFSKLTFNEAEAEKAAQTYNDMANALEKIQNGKSISKKDFETYGFANDDELKDLFRFGNSGYVLKDPADQKKVEELIKQKQRSGWDAKYLANEQKEKDRQQWINSGAGQYQLQTFQDLTKTSAISFTNTDAFKKYENSATYNNRKEFTKYLAEELAKNGQGSFQSNYSYYDAIFDNLYTGQSNEQYMKDIKKYIEDQNINLIKTDNVTGAQSNNNQNAQQMIKHLEKFADSQTQVELQKYKDQIANNNGQITETVYNNIYDLYQKLQSTYKDAEEDAEEAAEAQKEALQNIHDTVFPTDKDIDKTIVAQLGEQFQLTAQKSELLDDALKNNAKQAREVAEQVQRYDAALKSVIKNYGNWSNALQNGSTAEKLAVMPQIKNSMADTLGISDNVISNSFATTTENLENMRKALQGDKQAYKALQAAMYEDIIAHVGLDDKDLIAAKGLIEHVFDDVNLDDIEVGATLDDAQVQKVLARLIEMGIDSAETLEAIFATYYDVDLDVDIIDGKAQILSLTKAATHELKQQQKSQEELKDLERERIKNQKELTKFLKDERDIYHQINRLLSDQERTIKRITRNQQDMYGTELLDNLNAESAEYKKQQKYLKSKQQLQKQDLANKKAALMSKGASFDANGNISNYNNLISSAMNNVNSIISRERGVQEAMNQHLLNGGSTSDETYKDLDAQLSSIGREKNQANDYLNDLKTDLSNYEKVKDEAEDVADQLTEISEKQIEINLKKFNMKLEVTLDLSQATKTWNDYKRDVLQHDDVLNPNRAKSIQKDNEQRMADINSDSRSLDVINQQIEKAMADDGTLYKTQGQKKKALEEFYKKASQLRKGILENEDAIKQTYLEQYDIISEMFEKQKSQYEFINNQLEHNKNMMSLVYGENDYAVQNVYNDKMIENNLKSIESMNNRVQIAEENLRKAKESGNTAVIKKAEAEWQAAIQNRNQLEEQSAKLMKDRYTTAINQIAHQMEQKLTNNKGFNYMDTEWDLMKKQSNLYLDDINSAFAIKNTEYLYTQALNDTKSLKGQQQLKKVMNEQLNILKGKNKLTQYDVDRAQKLLKIEEARIALEQKRNNKTQMRLKRNSQGNYSYQYVADQDSVAKAKNDLQKAENDLYNFDKDNYENKLKEAYDATKEYQQKIAALEIEYATASEERRKQIDEEKRLLDQQYSKYILNLSQETEWGKQNLMDSAMMNFTDMMNQEQLDFENMSDAQKEKWLEDMVPSINTGIAEMIGKFSTDPDSFKQIIIDATQAMDNERKTYQRGLADLQKAAGQNWNNIKKAMDPVVKLQDSLIVDNDKLKKQAKEIVKEMDKTLNALNLQAMRWQNVYNKTDAAVKRVYDYIAAVDEAALKKLNEDENKDNKGDTGYTPPTTHPGPQTGGTTGAPQPKPKPAPSPLKTPPKPKSKQKTSIKDIYDLAKYFINYNNLQDWNHLHQEGKHKEAEKRIVFRDNVNQFGRYLSNLIRNKQTKGTIDTTRFRESLLDLIQSYDNYDSVGVGDWLARFTTLPATFLDKIYKDPFKIFSKFDTGGYTGDWSSTQGKLAVLHQKELVLNKEDTANMLEMIAMVREMQQQELQFRLSSLNNEIQDVMKQNAQVEKIKTQQKLLEQSVAISASFPSVNSKKEIEEALSELMNKATQIALKYKKN